MNGKKEETLDMTEKDMTEMSPHITREDITIIEVTEKVVELKVDNTDNAVEEEKQVSIVEEDTEKAAEIMSILLILLTEKLILLSHGMRICL